MASGSPIERVAVTNIHKNNGAITPCFQISPNAAGAKILRDCCPLCPLNVSVNPDANASCARPAFETGLVYISVPKNKDADKQQAELHTALQKAACGLDQDNRASNAFAAYRKSHPATP